MSLHNLKHCHRQVHIALDTRLSLLSLNNHVNCYDDILRCLAFKFDKLSDNLCAENMHLHGSIIQGSRYS